MYKTLSMMRLKFTLAKLTRRAFTDGLSQGLTEQQRLGLATNKGNPRDFLHKLMTKHPVASKQLGKAKITQIGYHAISLGGPINRTYANGFLAVGDCASQVKPTTGGGVIFGLTCAKIAAETASEAIKAR